mgnify:CR=1 FL=1
MAYTTINKPSDYFNTKLYTGNATNPTTISGIGFQPDWVWTKLRAGGTEGHRLCDAVRGATKDLLSNTPSAELTNTTGLLSFNSDGYVIGNSNGYNFNSATFVSWNWKANGQGSSNTDGSINTTYTSVNTTAGFSISKYTGNTTDGATVGHGLGAVPDMIIGKDLSDTSAWGVWHKDLTNAGYRLTLDTSAAQSDDTALFGGSSRTAPTSTVFSIGSGGGLNGPNANVVYCFTSIKGYSKIGSYTGNGNSDGTFVYTGFKPAWVMTKRTDTTSSWDIHDTKRDTFNVASKHLLAEDSGVEGNTAILDILSNGFKFRSSNADRNASGGTYIYMAFAESPLVGTNGVTAKAR